MTNTPRDLLEEQNPVIKILGWSDDVCECQRCGRTELKGTLICEHADGTISYMGSVCGAYAYQWGHALEKREEAKYARKLEKLAKDADYQRKEQARKDLRQHPDELESRRLIDALNRIEPPICYAERKIHPDYLRAHELHTNARSEINARYAAWGITVFC